MEEKKKFKLGPLCPPIPPQPFPSYIMPKTANPAPASPPASGRTKGTAVAAAPLNLLLTDDMMLERAELAAEPDADVAAAEVADDTCAETSVCTEEACDRMDETMGPGVAETVVVSWAMAVVAARATTRRDWGFISFVSLFLMVCVLSFGWMCVGR